MKKDLVLARPSSVSNFFQGPFVMKLSFGLIPKMQDSEFFSNLSYRHHCISPYILECTNAEIRIKP